MIIGPVAYWWDTDEYQHWNLPEHWHYVKWRQMVNDALIEHGYLVYRHWEALKGTWNNKMQGLNNIVLELSDHIICIRPDYAWSEGTDEELAKAKELGKKVLFAPPPETEEEFVWAIKELLENLGGTDEA
jgi:hypothetical protein